METLYYLLGARPKEGMSLENAQPAFDALIPDWLAILILALGAAWAFLVYARETGTLGWPRRILGALLRTAAIATLLLILLQPLLILTAPGKRDLPVVMLLDNSKSLRQTDPRLAGKAKGGKEEAGEVSRLAVLQEALRGPGLKLLDKLGERGPVEPFLFGTSLSRFPATEKESLGERLAAALAADQEGTALANAIRDTLLRQGNEAPAAVVIFTDGRDSKGTEPLKKLAEELAAKAPGPLSVLLPQGLQPLLARHAVFGPSLLAGPAEKERSGPPLQPVPLHIVGLGATKVPLLRIKQLPVDDTVFADHLLKLDLQYQARALEGETLEFTVKLGGEDLTLRHEGKDVKKIEIPARQGNDLRQELTFKVPKGKGPKGKGPKPLETRDLVVEVKVKGSARHQDLVKREVQISEEKIKVLYIEDSPRLQYKFLKESLLRKAENESERPFLPTFYLVKGDKEAAKGGPYLSELPADPEKFKKMLKEFNVLILGDVGPKVEAKGLLTPEQLEAIKEFVEKGGGLLTIAGPRAMPLAYVGSVLEEVLPVLPDLKAKPPNPELKTVKYQATPTQAGLDHFGILDLADTAAESRAIWEKLPGLHSFLSLQDIRGGARALIVNPDAKMGEFHMPILVTHDYGHRGQVIFMGSDETWRWRYNEEDKLFGRFWGQMLIHLGKPSLGVGPRRGNLNLDNMVLDLDEPASISGRLLNKDGSLLTDKEVEATVHHLDAPKGKPAVPLKITLRREKDGGYVSSFVPDQPGRYEIVLDKLDGAKFFFRVLPPPNHELEVGPQAEKELRELARVSGGRYYRQEELAELPPAVQPQWITFIQREEEPLSQWPLFAFFLCLVSAEWILRKFSDLS